MPESSESSLEIAAARFDSELARAQAFVQEAETNSALEAFGGCITWVEELLRSDPANPRFERWLAMSHTHRAEVLSQTDQVPQALEDYAYAVALFEKIRQRTDTSTSAVYDLVRARGNVLDILMDSRDRERARPVASELERLLESDELGTGEVDPDVLEIRAAGHSELGRFFGQWGPKRKASWHLSHSATLLEKALSCKPDDDYLQLNLAITCLLCGQNLGRSAATPWFEKSYDLLKAMQQRIELPPQGEQVLAEVRRSLGWEPLYGRGGPPRPVRLG